MFGLPSKRQRGSEELADLDSSAIHERKKFRSLALRTSPQCFQKLSFAHMNHTVSDLSLSTLTPVESSEDDDDIDGYPTHVHTGRTDSKGELPHQTAHAHIPHTAMDIDLDREMLHPVRGRTQCPWAANAPSNRDVQPSPIPHNLVNQSLTISERQAENSAYEYAHPSMNEQNPALSMYNQPSNDFIPSCSGIQRLPSPVSEGEDTVASIKDTVSDDVEMAYNSSRPASFSSSTWSGIEDRPPNIQQDMPPTDVGKDKQHGSAPKGVSNKKKISFSMGFRADCEKCRFKVPGHYSHIIRT
ncbi:uncharacterized protein BDW43DRAFT_120266 [Aspergillus alliaceus]|uniref:uncharacterized protein n=1 Tax=Petromyces alliaceus TaxID=209559 RepID=UPI0012A420CD|nr:uncharacterized protein BDW43DRAFT_120266 [Aspergillus alliaceus]KAB8238615.1 hypothetical protein BDW43DRAFT_120266 [Aspergillus alliaceus]